MSTHTLIRCPGADARGRRRRRTPGQSPDVLGSAPTSGASASGGDRVCERGIPGDALDVALVPERQREEAPELPRQIGAPGDVLVEHAPNGGRLQQALAAQRLGGKRLAGERLELAAQPGRRRDREAALASLYDLAGEERLESAAEEPLLLQPPNTLRRGQREGEVRDDRVEERHTRLERPRHRRAVGPHEQVVDQVGAEIDVLEARQELVSLGLRESLPKRRYRVPCGRATCELRALPGGEDLLPAVMALERRQMSCPREALRLVVEADPARRRGQPVDEGPRTRSEPAEALGEEVGDVGVVAAEQLVSPLARERDLDVLRGQLCDEVRRQRRRVCERLVEHVGKRG